MYKSKIFLVGKTEKELIALEESSYSSEDVLQELLEKYSDLLPGDQINPESPRRWLFISREMGIPGDKEEGSRWSLDHLFLDQDGIPTFVECKRSEDTRIRREVVAQMLDYAANGVEYWSLEKIRQSAAETAQKKGRSLNEDVTELLDQQEEIDVEKYWEMVGTNLKNRRVRLLFVADKIPKELRRLVEFLNEEMTNVEVLAVEIKQFKSIDDQDQKAIVPRVIGFTETAMMKKEPSSKRQKIDPIKFLEKIPDDFKGFYETILQTAKDKGYIIYWGELGFSIRVAIPETGKLASFLYCNPPNKFSFYFEQGIRQKEKLAESLKNELMEFGIFQESGKYTLTAFLTKENLESLFKAHDYIISKIGDLFKRS